MTNDLVKLLKEPLSQMEITDTETNEDAFWDRIIRERDEAAREIERLRDKCDKQAMILRRLTPEKHPNTLFISGVLGKRDQNNMPEKLMVVPAYGVDFCYIYEYNGKTTGQEW